MSFTTQGVLNRHKKRCVRAQSTNAPQFEVNGKGLGMETKTAVDSIMVGSEQVQA
jgi:hypothetical protein